MRPYLLLTLLLSGTKLAISSQYTMDSDEKIMTAPMDISPEPIPSSTREHWMRRANQALGELLSPCPRFAFGTAIVNHTANDDGLGELVCIGVNDNGREGNPTLHGEMAAIRNCTGVLTDPMGPYRLTGGEAIAAFRDLTLYTNGEPCPMVRAARFFSLVFLRNLTDVSD